MIHISNLFYHKQPLQLAKKIGALSFRGRTFFCNSGAEANEAALKFCRYYGHQIAPDKKTIITLERSFHGRTLGALSMTGQTKYQEGFSPIVPGIVHIPANNIEALEQAMSSQVCGIILEPVIAEGGVYPLSPEFARKARELCDLHKALLIFDEVQTGIGRTGTYFGYQHFNVEPDGITLAKALANGLPIGALHVSEKWQDVWSPGKHASTFGGNLLISAVAEQVLSLLEEELIPQVQEIGDYFKTRLQTLSRLYPDIIQEIRGIGLILAVQFKLPVPEIHRLLLDNGFITNLIGDSILRLTPPLIINREQIDMFVDFLNDFCAKQFYK